MYGGGEAICRQKPSQAIRPGTLGGQRGEPRAGGLCALGDFTGVRLPEPGKGLATRQHDGEDENFESV